MATQQALCPKPDAAPHSESFNRFVGVAGTRGLVAAGAGKERRQISLVETERKERRAYSRRFRRFPQFFLYWRSLLLRVVCRGVHRLFNRRKSSAVSAAKGAFATERFG